MKVAEITNALLKSTGLIDKKGSHLYNPKLNEKWKKRKQLVEKNKEVNGKLKFEELFLDFYQFLNRRRSFNFNACKLNSICASN
jgi:hypothetical protein